MKKPLPKAPLIWLLGSEPKKGGGVLPQLPEQFNQMVKCVTLEEAARLLRRQVKPRTIFIHGKPDRVAQSVLARLKSLEPELPVFLITQWESDREMRSWLSRFVVESVQPPLSERLGPANPYRLSRRELEILRLMAKCLIKKEIAERLAISYYTVDNHERNIFKKLNVHTRTAAVAKVLMERIC